MPANQTPDMIDDMVQIPLSDLALVQAALNSAYHQNAVLDLAEQYRKLQQRPQASKLTQALKNALGLVASSIELAAEEESNE